MNESGLTRGMRCRLLLPTCLKAALGAAGLVALGASAQEESTTALSCRDFRPTPEALERFPDLQGACESVVEREGELYGKFRAVVRRASSGEVTLYLPVTDHTFVVHPQPGARVLLEGRKVRPGDLRRGQEIQIYLAANAFARPDIEEVALVSETDAVIAHPAAAPQLMEHDVAAARSLPTWRVRR